MPNNIESRIVSLTFDNAQFEKNVATSRRTLKDLDEQIKFKDADRSFSNLTRAADKVSFSSLVTSAGTIGVAIEKSMSLGAMAMERLKDKVLDVGEHMLKTITNTLTKPIDDAFNQIKTGGWNRATNIDKAKFQLAGLGVAWDDIKDDIDYGVRGTAYGLDAAASVASQLVASSVELGDDMKRSLRGISGVAAMTSSSYEEIGAIFTKIAGNGRVMGDNLQSLSARGLNAAAVLAESMNTTEAHVREMVSAGEVDFATFAKAMDDAFGKHAEKANETFEGAFSNMNAALSRTGQQFAESYRANMTLVYDSLRLLFNAFNGDNVANLQPLIEAADATMQDISDTVKEVTNNVKTIFIDSGAWATIVAGIADVFEGVWFIIRNTASFFTDFIGLSRISVENVTKLADKFGDWAQRFREFAESNEFLDKLESTVFEISWVLGKVWSTFKTLIGLARDFGEYVAQSFAIFDHSTGKRDSGLHILAVGLTTVIGLLDDIAKSDALRTFVIAAESYVGVLVHAITSVISILKSLVGSVRTAFQRVFGQNSEVTDFGETIAWIFSLVDEWIDRIRPSQKFFDGLSKVLAALFSIIKMGAKLISALLNPILHLTSLMSGSLDKGFTGFWDAIGVGIGYIGDVITAFTKWLDKIGLFSKIQNGLTTGIDKVVSAIKTAVAWLKEAAKTVGEWIKSAIAWIKDMAVAFDNLVKNVTGYSIGEIFQKIGEHIKNAWESVKGFFSDAPSWITTTKNAFLEWVEKVKSSKISDYFRVVKETVSDLWDKVKGFFSSLASSKEVDDATEKMSPFAKIWETIKNVFSGVLEFFKAAWPVIQTIFGAIANVVRSAFNTLKDMLGNIDLSSFDLGDTLTGGGIAAGGAGLFLLFKKISDVVGSLKGGLDVFTGKQGLFTNISGTFGALKNMLVEYQKDIKADAILTIAKAVAVLAASLFVVALLDSNKIVAAGIAIGGLLGELSNMVNKLYGTSFKGSADADYGLKNMAMSMLLLSGAVLILAFAAARLSAIKVGDLVVGLAALHVVLGEVRSTVESLAKLGDMNMNGVALVLLLMAFAISKLIKPIQVLGAMNIMELLQGVIALKVVMKILSDTFELLDKTSKTWSSAKDMNAAVKMIKALAFAMILMVLPVKMFGKMDTKELMQGMAAVIVLIATLSAAMKILAKETESLKGEKLKTTKNGSLQGIASALLALSVAMVVLIIPLKALANIEWEEIGKLGAIIAGLLVMLALFNHFGGDTKGVLATVGALLGLALVLKLMIKPLEDLLAIRWEDIGKAGAIIAGLLVLLALFNHFGGETVGALATSVALIGIAFALRLMIKPLTELADISWGSIGKAGAILGGLLLALSILGMPAAIALLAIASAFVLLGLSVMFIGAGLLQISIGLGNLALVAAPAGKALAKMIEAIAEAMPAVIDSIFASGKALVSGLLGLLGTLITSALTLLGTAIQQALVTLAQIIIGVVELLKSIESLLIEDGIPSLCRIVVSAIDTLLATLAEHWPSIIDSLTVLLEGLLQMLIDLNPKISLWLESVLQILIDMLPKIKEFLIQLCMVIIEVAPYLGVAVMTLIATLLNMLPGIASLAVNAIVDTLIAICDGIGARAQEVVDAALNMLWEIIKAIFIGIWHVIEKIVDDIAELVQTIWPKIKEWFETKWQEIKDTGREILDKLKEGIAEIWQSVVDKVTGIWDAIVEFFDNIKEKIIGLGRKVINWLKGGVDEESDSLYEAGTNAGNKLVEGTSDSLDEHSPSKVAIEQGENYGEGLLIGAESYSNVLGEAGSDLGFSLTDGTNSSLADGFDLSSLDSYASYINGTSLSPTISPVLDSSQLTSSGLFTGEGAFNLSSIWAGEGGNGVLSSLSAIQENQNSDTTSTELVNLREELAELKSAIMEMMTRNTEVIVGEVTPRITHLEQAMYNMQVVMDSNAVVGQIAPKMDDMLGRYASFKGRGN